MKKGLLAWTGSPRSGSNGGLWAVGFGGSGKWVVIFGWGLRGLHVALGVQYRLDLFGSVSQRPPAYRKF